MATILYVDDEDPIRRALRSLLGRRGHTVLVAASGNEARAMLDTHEVDGILIDIWLGNESGFDLFEWVDMNKPALSENAVFVTGDIVPQPEVQQALAAFERPVLTKPFELGELERIISSWGR